METNVAQRVSDLLAEAYNLAKSSETEKINSPALVAGHMAGLMRAKTEKFYILLLDNSNRLIRKKLISKGTVDQTPVFPREVVKAALLADASGVILVHNHPGGDPSPSSQDRELTSKIKRICVDMGIRLLDHVVVSRTGHFSFQEYGYL